MQIGIDIVKVSRFRNKKYNSNQKFYETIFTIKEIKYCLKYKDPYTHFAGKFAIKEAVKKSIKENVGFKEITTTHRNSKPRIILKKKLITREKLLRLQKN